MSVNLASHEIITSALQLPLAERELVVDALQNSLIDKAVDHGPEEPADEVQAAWSNEISRRIADLDSGRTKPIPADAAERMIRVAGGSELKHKIEIDGNHVYYKIPKRNLPRGPYQRQLGRRAGRG